MQNYQEQKLSMKISSNTWKKYPHCMSTWKGLSKRGYQQGGLILEKWIISGRKDTFHDSVNQKKGKKNK